MANLVEVTLLPPPASLSKTEEDIVAALFTNPAIKKYLNLLLWNTITEHANTPLPQLASEPWNYAIRQAFVKGHIGCIQDLLSIEKAPTPVSKPTPE